MVNSAVGIVCENLQSLLGYEVDRDVAACLYGTPLAEPIPPQTMRKSIHVLEENLEVFTRRRAAGRRSRHILLSGSLAACTGCRAWAADARCNLWVALTYGIRYTPGTLFTSRFFRFAGRSILPTAQGRFPGAFARDDFYDQ